jgi:hypothetical protein
LHIPFIEWHKPKIQIQIITYNRPYSLLRLLASLDQAIYLGDTVSMTFNVEAEGDQTTMRLVNDFTWPFGPKRIHHRISHAGLMSAIVESWYPDDRHEYSIFLEDDIELSPLFYVWAKLALLKYRYGHTSDRHVNMFGISLYTPRIQELTYPRERINPYLEFSTESTPFLFQVPCSWGALYFPEQWRQFHGYMAGRLLWKRDQEYNASQPTPGSIPDVFVPKSRSNSWKHSWKKYFIELVVLHGYVMLYPNFQNQTSFSTNHLEPGMHISRNSKVRNMVFEFQVPLMQREEVWLLKQLPNGRLPAWTDLPIRNLIFRPTDMETLVQTGKELNPFKDD